MGVVVKLLVLLILTYGSLSYDYSDSRLWLLKEDYYHRMTKAIYVIDISDEKESINNLIKYYNGDRILLLSQIKELDFNAWIGISSLIDIKEQLNEIIKEAL